MKSWALFGYAHLKMVYFSTENGSSLEADKHFKPLPRPRSMLKKHSHREEKDGLGKDETTALHEELEAHSAPSPFPKLSDRQLEAMKKLFSETLDPEVSTTVELLACALELRSLQLIMEKRIFVCMHVHVCGCLCVSYMFSSVEREI